MHYKHSVQHFTASSIIFNFLLFNKCTMKVRLILYLTQLPKQLAQQQCHNKSADTLLQAEIDMLQQISNRLTNLYFKW